MSTSNRNFDLKVGVGLLPSLVHNKEKRQGNNSSRHFTFTQKPDLTRPMATQSGLLSALVPLTKLIEDSKASRSPVSEVTAPQSSPQLRRKKRVRPKTERRREQCRNNQARYRKRQQGFVQELEKSVHDLQNGIQKLNEKRHMLCYGIQTKNNIWNVVVEYFRMLRYGFLLPMCGTEHSDVSTAVELQDQEYFLRAVMIPDVVIGALCGVEALINQWQRYSSYFGNLFFKLKRMEQHPIGMMEASATLSLTITEATLQCVFPHILNQVSKVANGDDDIYTPLCARLLGQRIDCQCSVRFSWDDLGSRVTKLESTLDLLTPLMRILGNVEDVSYVLKEAVITPEYLIGEVPMRASTVRVGIENKN